MRILIFAVPLGAVTIAGCVSIPREAGFDSVQQTVQQRIGHTVVWNQLTPNDQAVADRVQRLLIDKPLDERSAVQVALLCNQNLQATYEDLGVAQAELVEAGLLRNPVLSAEVRFPDLPAIPYEIDVMHSFIDLLMLPIRKRQSEAAFAATKARVTQEILNTAADVKAAFFKAQGAEQLVEMRRQVVETTHASYTAAGAMHDAGNMNDLDFGNQRAEYEQAKIDLQQAQASALDAREELNAGMGVWGEQTKWTIAPRLPEIPKDEAETNGLESLAIHQRPELEASRQQVEIAAQAAGLSRAAAFSEIDLGAHAEKDADGALTIGPAIKLPLPIFNQGQPAIAEAAARYRQSQARFRATAVQIRSEVRRRRNEMTAAQQRADYDRKVILPLRHDIVAQSVLHYNAMTIGVFQLLEAKRAEIDAGRDYVEALQAYWIARAELERAVGGELPVAKGASTQPVARANRN